jgi:NADH:ubiquinone oxidoreductase subunit 6 (subunit J)
MDLATLIFWIIAFVLVGSALVVVIQRNIVHSALALILVFAMASGIYLLLNAEFIAIVQILIYAGAVAVLILFALMLTRTSNIQVNSNPNGKLWWLALPICALVAVGIIFATTVSPYATTATTNLVGYGDKAACALPPNNVAYIGELLYSPTCYSYVLPFEIASVVLLVAIMGAIVIGRED